MNKRDETQFLNSIGKRLAAARRERGLSQEKLSDLSGLDRVAIGYIEQSRRQPTLRTVYRLATAMDLSLTDLFEGY